MAINILVTHSGGFHADELLSSVVLTRLFPEASLMRSRDELCITPATDKIIYDVGGNYDIEAQIFDHHQSPGPLRDNGQPFSSFGLIWKHYGCAYLESLKVPSQNIDPIHAQLDDDFVLPIDLVDNGVIEPSVARPMSHLTLPVLLDNLRPVFDDGSTHADAEAFLQPYQSQAASLKLQSTNGWQKPAHDTSCSWQLQKQGNHLYWNFQWACHTVLRLRTPKPITFFL
jgi:uncharacterized UPF0160 family protein